MRLSTGTIAAGCVAFCTVVVGIVAVIVTGHDPAVLIAFAGSALLNATTLIKADRVGQKVDTVVERVNGPLTHISDQVDEVHQAVVSEDSNTSPPLH